MDDNRAFLVFGCPNSPWSYGTKDKGEAEWPEAELTNGIAHIEMFASGDSMETWFLKVWGVGEERTCLAWEHVANHLPDIPTLFGVNDE